MRSDNNAIARRFRQEYKELSDYVYLTKSGKDWVTVIRKNEETLAKDQDSQNM